MTHQPQARSNTPPSPLQTQADACHRYAIEYAREDGRPLGSLAVEPDFQPALEWTYFVGVRRGFAAAVTAAAAGRVRPLWCDDRGAPYCRGVSVAVSPHSPREALGEPVRCEIPASYFDSLAKEGAQQWLEKGELETGERYTYRVCAYPIAGARRTDDCDATTRAANSGFRVEVVPSPIPVQESALGAFRRRASLKHKSAAIDIPVFISESSIDEALSRAREAKTSETGGVLVGHLHRDASQPESFVEITAQIPARHAEASGTSFAFTSETWAAADAAIELRGRHELILGWWHSHPRFCNPDCPPERQRVCPVARPFFSSDDIHLHRVCFPQAYQIALLISDLPDNGPTPTLFGWRNGVVAERGYSTLA
jgi:hypothetical protein